jgi:tryptophan 2,3-dioxygenase
VAVDDLTEPILPGPGASDYERYLRTDELLSLQPDPENSSHRDELLFTTVHQSSELWLKLAWNEVEEATRLLASGRARSRDPSAATGVALRPVRHGSARHAGADVALGIPGDPEEARPRQRFRLARLPRDPADHAGPRAGAFEAAPGTGLSVVDLYVQGREHEQLYQLAECLTDWDERLTLWRMRHYKVVSRIIGDEVIGTQGTPVELLGGLIKQKFFPELWDARNKLTELANEE